jgi:hypothetical protein
LVCHHAFHYSGFDILVARGLSGPADATLKGSRYVQNENALTQPEP